MRRFSGGAFHTNVVLTVDTTMCHKCTTDFANTVFDDADEEHGMYDRDEVRPGVCFVCTPTWC